MKHNRPPRAAKNPVRLGGVRLVSAAALAVAACALWTIPASAATAAHAAKKVSTKTTVSASTSAADVNTSLTLFATVKGSGKTPTGTVTFTNTKSGKKLCSAKLSGGKAHCSAKFSSAGTYKVKGAYGGNSTHSASSGTITVKAVKAPTSTVVTSSPASPNPGQAVTLTAKVAGGATPAGTVTFTGASGKLCAKSLAAGKATCTHSWAKAGSEKITVSYAGNAAHLPSSTESVVDVAAGAQIGTVTSITQPSYISTQPSGEPFTIEVSVVTTAGAPVPTGTVEIVPTNLDASDPALIAEESCNAPLTADGTGSCVINPPAGAYGFTLFEATYEGNATYATSNTGDQEHKLINPSTTTTTVGPDTGTTGTAMTLTATVVDEGGNILAAYSDTPDVVNFTAGVGGAALPGCTGVAITWNGTNDTATCAYTPDAAGTYPIAATFPGDEYADASTGTETLTVSG